MRYFGGLDGNNNIDSVGPRILDNLRIKRSGQRIKHYGFLYLLHKQ